MSKNKALEKAEKHSNLQMKLSDGELSLIKDTITPGATQEQFNLFVYDCQSRGLNPLKKEIYWVTRAVKRKVGNDWKTENVASHQVSIDGFRIIAQRSGEYAGQTKVEFGDNVKLFGLDVPEYAEVGVYREGFSEPLYARAYFTEYAQAYGDKLGNMWQKMPRLMIAKCAESLALRKAFPDCLAGLYTTDEMAQSENEEKSSVAVVEKEVAEKSPVKEHDEKAREIAENSGEFKKDLNISVEFKKKIDEYAEIMSWGDATKDSAVEKMLNGKSLLDADPEILKKYIEQIDLRIKKEGEAKADHLAGLFGATSEPIN